MKQLRDGVLLIAASIGIFFALANIVAAGSVHNLGSEVELPLLAIGGVVALLAILAVVSVTFGVFGLSDKSQALALPEGSIRAVIALSLVILFGVLSVFLYGGVASAGPPRQVEHLTEGEKGEFTKNNPNARDIVVVQEAPAKDVADGALKYTITYRDPTNQPSDDFAKQLLLMIGTLMTAVASFYFGARTASSQATDAGRTLPPTIRSVQPVSFSLASGPVIDLQIQGDNLNAIKHVKIVIQGAQIDATEVVSNDSIVKCRVPVTPATAPLGKWNVVVVDAASKAASVDAALTMTA